MGDLTVDELAVLDFEDQWWRYGGAKEEEIRQVFGTTPVRHYQRLTSLIDRPEALAAHPVLVRRLQRIRDRRRRAVERRAPGRSGESTDRPRAATLREPTMREVGSCEPAPGATAH